MEVDTRPGPILPADALQSSVGYLSVRCMVCREPATNRVVYLGPGRYSTYNLTVFYCHLHLVAAVNSLESGDRVIVSASVRLQTSLASIVRASGGEDQ